MKAEEVIELYDSFWFEHQIFKGRPNSSISPLNSHHEIQQEPSDWESSWIRTVDSSSMSESDSLVHHFFSPNSVFLIPSPCTDSSGNDVAEDLNHIYNHLEAEILRKRKKKLRKRREHKSLSKLEFEELKGFMDMGFVFSEEDKDSSLASIIPGLHRLGKKKEDEEEGFDEYAIRRPYLSETWEVMERKKKEKSLMNWRIPAASSEVSMKDNLKLWAHVVASTVR